MNRRVEPRLQLLPGIGLVDLNHPELTQRLAGIAAEKLEQFQARMREGLLAASVAVGLGVLGELLAAEVTDSGGTDRRPVPEFRSWWAFSGVLAGGYAGQRVATCLTGPKTWAHD